jgi:hypothetical protein
MNNTLSITDKEKADTLASFYRDVHDLQLNTRQLTTKQKEINRIAQVLQKTNYKNTRQYDRDNLTDPTEILTIIKSLPNNKAPGPDNIPNKVIKKPQQEINSPTSLHNKCNNTVTIFSSAMENRNNSSNPKTEKRLEKPQQLPPHKPPTRTRKGGGKGN